MNAERAPDMKWPNTWTLHSPGGKVFGRLIVFRRKTGDFVIYDPHLPLGEDAGVFDRADDACARALELSKERPANARSASQFNADAESFAGMKRALANGFAPHEPAEDVAPLPFAGINRDLLTLREARPADFNALLAAHVNVNGNELVGQLGSTPDLCPKCDTGFCELDCTCACHEASA